MSSMAASNYFWVYAAHSQLEKIQNPNPLQLDKIRDFVAQIRAYTLDEEAGFYLVIKQLYSYGLTVLLQSLQTESCGVFILHGRPCMVLNHAQRGDSWLWLSLLEELYYVLFEYKELQAQGYHLSKQGELFLSEHLSAYFAQMLLLDQASVQRIAQQPLNAEYIRAQAAEQKIHPAVLSELLRLELQKQGKKPQNGLEMGFNSPKSSLLFLQTAYWEHF